MTEFFNIDNAINSKYNDGNAFIIANERQKKDKSIGRTYIVFSNYDDFLKNRIKYKHCHELIVDHTANTPNIAGRLVFDFDIKYDKNLVIPDNFKAQVKHTIKSVIKRYYESVDITVLQFVWSSCENSLKLSKHLTVKNMYFENWIPMTKIFYRLFCHIWDKRYDWIQSDKLIDFQIVRKNASLRMVGSSKIGGNVLKLDNANYQLDDSLIRIYTESERENEQLITDDNINYIAQKKILRTNDKSIDRIRTITIVNTQPVAPQYAIEVYDRAFEICNFCFPGVFKKGKITGSRLDILRVKKYRCIMSKKVHENENAFLIISHVGLYYNIKYGCYRYCNKDYKTYNIGTIKVSDNTIDNIESNFLAERLG